jgi:hypothetical protein
MSNGSYGNEMGCVVLVVAAIGLFAYTMIKDNLHVEGRIREVSADEIYAKTNERREKARSGLLAQMEAERAVRIAAAQEAETIRRTIASDTSENAVPSDSEPLTPLAAVLQAPPPQPGPRGIADGPISFYSMNLGQSRSGLHTYNPPDGYRIIGYQVSNDVVVFFLQEKK